MKIANRQFVAPVLKFAGGFSLSEMLVVISVIVLLIGIGIPAARQIIDSFESSAGLKNVMSAALSNARAIATKNQKYAGLRFQQDSAGRQYIIFIEYDSAIGPLIQGNIGCRAVAGRKPIKLSTNVGIMDLKIKEDYGVTHPVYTDIPIKDIDDALSNAHIDNPEELLDTTTFSILFSPNGKLVIHTLKVSHSTIGNDVFNTKTNVDAGIGMFIEDENWNPVVGIQLEHSRNSFVIYDKRAFAAVDTDSRWTDYLSALEVLYITSYTGEIINK